MVVLDFHDLVIYACCGVVTGFLSGLLGVGGGIIIVPSLVAIFTWDGFPVDRVFHFAAGTSFAVMLFTTLFSFWQHNKQSASIKSIYTSLCYGVVVGVVTGSVMAHFLHPSVLRWIFAGVMLLVAAKLFFIGKLEQLSTEAEEESHPVAGFCIGCISSLLGIGGSTFTVPYLLSRGVSMRQAIVASSALGVTIAVVGVVAYSITGLFDAYHLAWSVGYVYWPAAAVMSVFCFLTVTGGVWCSHRLPVRLLQRIFALFVLIIAAHMAAF